MAYITGTKLYAIIHKTTTQCGWTSFGFSYETPNPEPTPLVDIGYIAQYVSAGDLNGQTIDQFLAIKTPVLSGDAFDHWEDKHDGLQVGISENPFDDGSNSPEVYLTGGLPGSAFCVSYSRPVSCNLPGCAGVLGGYGEATFKIRVHGTGNFTVTVAPEGHNDFKTVTLNITVDSGPFA